MLRASITDGVISSPFAGSDVRDLSIPQLIREQLGRFPEKVVAVDGDVSVTASELIKKIERYACGFQKCGLGPGSRVCVYTRNGMESMAAALGAVFAGGTLVMAKATLISREVLYQIQAAGCSHVLTDLDCASKILDVKNRLQLKGLFSLGMVPGFTDVHRFQESSELDFQEYVPSDTKRHIIVVLFTTGSSGLPKGVELSHKAYVRAYRAAEALNMISMNDVILAWNPFTHVSGFALNVFSICFGATTVFQEPDLNYQDFCDILSTYNVTCFLGFPGKMQELVSEAKISAKKPGPVKRIYMGGSPLSRTLAKDIASIFRPQCLINLYGLTETCGLGTATDPNEVNLDGGGFPCFGTKIKIVDPASGKTMAAFDPGEIWLQSSNCMNGYYANSNATEATYTSDGWLRTGDLGYYDERGSVFILDRLKEMIKCMDNQVAPAELEAILLTHAAVKEVAVVGIPSSKYGEAPGAIVVLQNGCTSTPDLIQAELESLVAAQTAVHKHLYAGVVFVSSIPKAENGKRLTQGLKSKFPLQDAPLN